MQMHRPRPDPPGSRSTSSPSSRENFRNSWSSRSAGTPLPLAATETATWTPSHAAATQAVAAAPPADNSENTKEAEELEELQEPPPAPQNLTATVNEDGSIDLTWDAPEDDSITGYQTLHRQPLRRARTPSPSTSRTPAAQRLLIACLIFTEGALMLLKTLRRKLSTRAGRWRRTLRKLDLPCLEVRLKRVKRQNITTPQANNNEGKYQRYLFWRSGQRHQTEQGKPERPKPKICPTCNDTRLIIRGYDGRRITCPSCRLL